MSSHESQKPPPKPSNVTSVKFWSSGGLLGLEPSKPPDFSVLNALAQDPVAERNAKISTLSQSNNFGGDGDKWKPNKLENSMAVKWGSDMGCFTSCQDYKENYLSLRERSCKDLPADLNVKATTAWQENSRSAAWMFEIGNKIILNGHKEKLSLGGDEISDHDSYLRTVVFEHNNR